MESTLCFAAEGIVQDERSGAISAYNIIEKISAEGFPLFIQKLGVVNILMKRDDEPEQFDMTFLVEVADEVEIEREVAVDFEGDEKNRTIVTINGVVLENPGTLSFRFRGEEGEDLGSYSVPVQVREPAVEADNGE